MTFKSFFWTYLLRDTLDSVAEAALSVAQPPPDNPRLPDSSPSPTPVTAGSKGGVHNFDHASSLGPQTRLRRFVNSRRGQLSLDGRGKEKEKEFEPFMVANANGKPMFDAFRIHDSYYPRQQKQATKASLLAPSDPDRHSLPAPPDPRLTFLPVAHSYVVPICQLQRRGVH
ncbi:hypothetical protein BDK51DRAFT_37560 [Blyttiomyces helicus]|uniref:Uncharacterized protein n=1 Tax=Blyttiomyces helicus TaxID=388810 RepID=A0A4P9WIP8_9FUNG|nr:hypothetical protein BDK51DRAFT_37560 [Blyttiomyces helicus]|eukprot:RKO92759.1 hypothetical protein BDK51DRAFT_37560 [Blyttiomyces helicus]